jgi:hypothetical protein
MTRWLKELGYRRYDLEQVQDTTNYLLLVPKYKRYPRYAWYKYPNKTSIIGPPDTTGMIAVYINTIGLICANIQIRQLYLVPILRHDCFDWCYYPYTAIWLIWQRILNPIRLLGMIKTVLMITFSMHVFNEKAYNFECIKQLSWCLSVLYL